MSDGLSTQQLLASNPVRGLLPVVLQDEARLGRIERTADGRWQATPALVETFASAFSYLADFNERRTT